MNGYNQQALHDAAQVLNAMGALAVSLIVVGVYLLWKRWPR